jgi:hypothetical protein
LLSFSLLLKVPNKDIIKYRPHEDCLTGSFLFLYTIIPADSNKGNPMTPYRLVSIKTRTALAIKVIPIALLLFIRNVTRRALIYTIIPPIINP